jgi:hypothetical protein
MWTCLNVVDVWRDGINKQKQVAVFIVRFAFCILTGCEKFSLHFCYIFQRKVAKAKKKNVILGMKFMAVVTAIIIILRINIRKIISV